MENRRTVAIVVLVLVVIFACAPLITRGLNRHDYAVQKADDATNYETLKEVEDTCRAMIASYTADKMRYETYATSDSAEQQSWAEQAKIRANNTAAKYNEYFLKNSFVWADNIPRDISWKLEYIP